MRQKVWHWDMRFTCKNLMNKLRVQTGIYSSHCHNHQLIPIDVKGAACQEIAHPTHPLRSFGGPANYEGTPDQAEPWCDAHLAGHHCQTLVLSFACFPPALLRQLVSGPHPVSSNSRQLSAISGSICTTVQMCKKRSAELAERMHIG